MDTHPVTSAQPALDAPEPARRVRRVRDWWMWVAVLGAPTVWLAHLQAVYSIAWWSYHSHRKWPMHLSVIASLLLCAAIAWAGWRTYRRADLRADDGERQAEVERVRMMGHLALWGTALFVLGIAAQWVAVFMINPAVD